MKMDREEKLTLIKQFLSGIRYECIEKKNRSLSLVKTVEIKASREVENLESSISILVKNGIEADDLLEFAFRRKEDSDNLKKMLTLRMEDEGIDTNNPFHITLIG
jgi:hypothetical protein